jgi:hypothetical protein
MLLQLHSFAKNQDISVEFALQYSENDFQDMFHQPLSMVATQQCDDLRRMLTAIPQQPENDSWSFSWGEGYATKKMYNAIIKPPEAPAPFQWIWKSCCLPKHKFFSGFFCWID